jgi:signal transduction histidine kinase
VLGVFVALTLLLLAGLILWQYQEARRTAALLRGLTEESGDAVTRIVELDGRTLQQFVADYSPWDELVRFVRTGDADWARTNLVAVQSNYQADTLWVYSPDRRRVFGWASDALRRRGLTGLAPPETAFARLDDARQLHYYAEAPGGGVLEVRAATVHPSDDLERRGAPRGYLFAGRLWDDRAVKQMEPLTGFNVRLLDRAALTREEAEDAAGDANGDREGAAGGGDGDDTTIRIRYRLLDMDGRTVGAFAFARPSSAATESLRASRRVIAYVAVADALTISLLFWALHAYITAPLSAVAGYLASPSPNWLGRLARAGTEFRRIGGMLGALARSQDERAALSSILAEVSRPLRRREVMEAFARGAAGRLGVSAGVVLVPNALGTDGGAEGGATSATVSSDTNRVPPPPLRCEIDWGLPDGLGERIAAAYGEVLAARRAAAGGSPAKATASTASSEGLPAPPGLAFVRDDPALVAAGVPPTRADLAARRIVPLVASGALRGVAVFFGPEEDPAGDGSHDGRSGDLYAALGSGVAVALENARLFEEARESEHALQTLSHRLVEVQEQERAHLARELHDEIGQMLTGLRLTMALAEQAKTDEDRQTRREEIRAILAELTQQVRTMSLDLRPPQLDDFGLTAAVTWLAQRFSGRTGVEVALNISPDIEERRFGTPVETAAYRIVQEALTNVARHSGSRDATVRLWVEPAEGKTPECLCLEVEDDGAGFAWDGRAAAPKDPAEASPRPTGGGLDGPGESWAGGGSGLLGMRERAELLGGRFHIATAPGEGTAVTVSFPLRGAGTGHTDRSV